MATFSTSHTCQMWRIWNFSTSVLWRHLKFLHMCKNFRSLYICYGEKLEISPRVEKCSISPQLSYMESWKFSTWQFFSTNNLSDISDKYEVCPGLSFFSEKKLKNQWQTWYLSLISLILLVEKKLSYGEISDVSTWQMWRNLKFHQMKAMHLGKCLVLCFAIRFPNAHPGFS